jgi:4'-phosphopantetheinyl transferase
MTELPSNTVHVWYYNIDPNQGHNSLINGQQILTTKEIERAHSYKYQHLKDYALARRYFERTILSKYHNTHPKDWVFNKQKNGKPEISLPTTDIRFNLSHSKGKVVCAVTRNKNIGIDIEKITSDIDILTVAKNYFSKTEVNHLTTLKTPAQKLNLFYSLWTLKEAYVKATGTGLSHIDKISFTTEPLGHQRLNNTIIFENKLNQPPEMWQFWLSNHIKGFRVAVALNAPQSSPYQLEFYELNFTAIKAAINK